MTEIAFKGNKITKESILSRELTFSPGESHSKDSLQKLLESSRQNLLNTGLFNFVEIDGLVYDDTLKEVRIVFNLTERWYLWPIPLLEIADRNINSWLESGVFNRLNYGILLEHDNVRGRMEKLGIIALNGMDQQLGFTYEFPYIDKSQKLGLQFSAIASHSTQVIMAAEKNRPVWLSSDDHLLERFSGYAGMTYRPAYFEYHALGLKYHKYSIMDSLVGGYPEFLGSGEEKNGTYLGLSYVFKYDQRDQHYFPLKGEYFDLKINFGGGLGHGPLEPSSSFLVNYRKYLALSPRLFLGTGIAAFYSFPGSSPFIFQRGLGFDRKFVRGYEDYIFPSDEYFLLKLGLNYSILSPREFDLLFVRARQFKRAHIALYLGPFIDFAIFNDDQVYHTDKQMDNTLIGYGVGLNIVSYYDKVLRLEYSMNRQGNHGLYVHVIAPI